MTHPFIGAALRYRRAQAKVLQEAEAWEQSPDDEALRQAVVDLREARKLYFDEKQKTMAGKYEG